MEIKDIIKTDYDRLFIVDPECYIIFTGDSTEDVQPFIRIGNWIDMPVELIPLIENIIITDNIIGNPAHEQFNIDIRYLSTNRYIGSKNIVNKFLDFQKIFGLDLKNASIVNIEKDIPELSKEENISQKDQFIGVFYRDGNFKTVFGYKTIFDRKKAAENPINIIKLHRKLTEINKNTHRYDGSGMVITGHNPMFYKNKRFCSYLVPDNYFEDFSDLNIDPEKLDVLLYPTQNFISISKFLKWKNSTVTKAKIFTNSSDISFVKKLFPDSISRTEDFNDLSYTSDTGLKIKNFHNTYNLKLTYSNNTSGVDELTIAYIKGTSGIKKILREKLDAIFITYSAFEDISMLFKSSDIPLAIIDDGNKNISKLWDSEKIILNGCTQYDFQKFETIEEIYNISSINSEIISDLNYDYYKLADRINTIIDSEKNDLDHQKKLFNLSSFIRLQLFSTSDRKLASKLKSISAKLHKKIDRSLLFEDHSKFILILIFFNNSIFQFILYNTSQKNEKIFNEIKPLDDNEKNDLKHDVLRFHNRIIEDRERLQDLLDIYVRSSNHFTKNIDKFSKLKSAIELRKKEYSKEKLSLERSGIGANLSKKNPKQIPSEQAEKEKGLSIRIKTLPKTVKIFAPVLLFLVIAALLLITIKPVENNAGKENVKIVESREIDKKFSELNKMHNIEIKDYDIYQYTNIIALKNGYNEISRTNIKENNPNWIYPTNVFVLLDGQKVTVSKGDTLWNLSKNKLIEMSINFKNIIKKLEDCDKDEKDKLIDQAKKFAFTKEQKELLENISANTNE